MAALWNIDSENVSATRKLPPVSNRYWSGHNGHVHVQNINFRSMVRPAKYFDHCSGLLWVGYCSISGRQKFCPQVSHFDVNQCTVFPCEWGVPTPTGTAQPSQRRVIPCVISKRTLKNKDFLSTRV